jgi:hypothetical protein
VALEHELARLEPDDRRRARTMMRVAAPVRPLVAVADEHHVVAVAELLADLADRVVRVVLVAVR